MQKTPYQAFPSPQKAPSKAFHCCPKDFLSTVDLTAKAFCSAFVPCHKALYQAFVCHKEASKITFGPFSTKPFHLHKKLIPKLFTVAQKIFCPPLTQLQKLFVQLLSPIMKLFTKLLSVARKLLK
jgi:hypothetical protein